jgi:hypothetical protein
MLRTPPPRRIAVMPVPASLPLLALVHLDGRPRYVHSGWFLISAANLVVIVLMIVVFALAIALPFPGTREKK